jgi:serralysin
MARSSAREARAAAPANTTDVAWSGDPRIDALLIGSRWSGPSLSYSDPDRGSDYGMGYPADDDLDGIPASRDGFAPLSPAQRRAMHAALDADPHTQPAAHAGFSLEGLTALKVTYAGAGSGAGTLRFANSGDAASPPDTAYAYYPSSSDTGGDVWFDHSGRRPAAGNYDALTLLHETGHALGLRHGHEIPGALPAAWDSLEFTVMTYRSYIGAPVDYYHEGPVDFPQSFMMLDIAALQHLYGADFTTNAGNTTYSWNPATGATSVNGAVAITPAGNRVFLTVWDGGGADTYDLSAYGSDLAIDLRPGKHSTFAPGQLADLGGGPNGGHARGNLFNALQHHGDPRSLIENATGGRGDDQIMGNGAKNRLAGNAGDDRLLGLGGADRLLGGDGADALRGGTGADSLTGGAGRDRFEFAAAADSPTRAACDVIADFGAPGLAKGDLVDLSEIDARGGRGGDQSFLFGGQGQGHLRLLDSADSTLVCADTRGSTAYDFVLEIADASPADFTRDDFIL